MERQIISGLEFAQKLVSTWNATHGSEWNNNAACYVRASLWNKKQGEIRVYFDKGYVKFSQAQDGVGVNFYGFKYGIDGLVKQVIGQISSEFKCGSLMPKPARIAWFNEDGEEVDAADPDAVFKKEVY